MSVTHTPKPLKKRKSKLDENLLAYRGVWVFVARSHNHAHPVS
jgi:electron transfer flavoprotein alpha subunit